LNDYFNNLLEKEEWQYNKAGSLFNSNFLVTPAVNSSRAVSAVENQ